MGDFTLALINRVFLEKVNGEYQGACFPFLDSLQSAVLQMAFLPDGSMLVGESNRGWNSLGSRSFGLERIRWKGGTPFDILRMEAQPDGFLLTFTEALDPAMTLGPDNFKLSSYTYLYQAKYGSPETDTQEVEVAAVILDSSGRSVRLVCPGLRRGFVHELQVRNLRSQQNQPLWHDRAYYSLNHIPSRK